MIKQPIKKERWDLAQQEEKGHHLHESIDFALKKWNEIYKFYFRYTNTSSNLNGRTVLEIGPARLSALLFCENYGHSFIVEPITYEDSEYLYKDKPITYIRELYEECDSPIVDEIWLFNVLQHILDPDAFVEKCKKSAKLIRFFEPINTPIEPHHPHSFSQEDYVQYFGDSVKFYKGGTEWVHEADCVYGVYEC